MKELQNILPPAAGLTILLPNPPNTCFTTPVAKIAATTTTYIGVPIGKIKAKINAVT